MSFSCLVKAGFIIFPVLILAAFSDSWKPPASIALSHPDYFPEPYHKPTDISKESVELGRRLFYDPILSADSTVSCSFCHRQEAAFSDANLKFSFGISGKPLSRNTPGLFNLAWYKAYFWDGRAATLQEQALHPVNHMDEMGFSWPALENRLNQHKDYRSWFKKAFGSNTIDSNLISKALAHFQFTLVSFNSKYDKVLRGEAFFTEEELAGFSLMNEQNKGDCLHCHTTDPNGVGTTGLFSNNGLDHFIQDSALLPDAGVYSVSRNVNDRGKFKIPSLRNLLYTAPYMHDGRFQTLEDVLDFYSENVKKGPYTDSRMQFAHRGGVQLTEKEKKEIIAFLKTMSDPEFVTNKKFGNPF